MVDLAAQGVAAVLGANRPDVALIGHGLIAQGEAYPGNAGLFSEVGVVTLRPVQGDGEVSKPHKRSGRGH